MQTDRKANRYDCLLTFQRHDQTHCVCGCGQRPRFYCFRNWEMDWGEILKKSTNFWGYYDERVKEIIESQKTGTRKTRKDAVLVNELLVTSDRDFFEQLDPGEQKRFFEESYKLFSERYGKQNIAYATVHNDEQTPHMHLGVVPMRDGKLQGKNVFNRQELLWLQDKFPEHMKKQGFELKRSERGSDRKHIETAKFKKQTLEKEIDFLEKI